MSAREPQRERLSPREQDEVNAAILRMAEADPANWREDATGRYYIGPRWAGDGTIDWHDDGWPE